MTTLATPTIYTSSPALTWDKESRRFVAEASDLPTPGRVYDDACDVGLTLYGKHGERVEMVLEDEKHDAEGDLLYTDYKPISPIFARMIAGLRVFND